METKIIKDKSEFKDGDILSYTNSYGYLPHMVLIFHKNGNIRESIVSLVSRQLFKTNMAISDYIFRELNYATEEEKHQLFDALEKEGKTWDAEKKQIVDLSKKCEFKPFDKVLGRNTEDGIWEAEIFSHYEEGSQYPFRCVGYSRKYCIPYNENTKHLLGTTNNLNKYEG